MERLDLDFNEIDWIGSLRKSDKEVKKSNRIHEQISPMGKKLIIEKEVKDEYAVATDKAKEMGYSDFSEGSEGAKKRDEIAEALKKGDFEALDRLNKWISKQRTPPRPGLVFDESKHRWIRPEQDLGGWLKGLPLHFAEKVKRNYESFMEMSSEKIEVSLDRAEESKKKLPSTPEQTAMHEFLAARIHAANIALQHKYEMGEYKSLNKLKKYIEKQKGDDYISEFKDKLNELKEKHGELEGTHHAEARRHAAKES